MPTIDFGELPLKSCKNPNLGDSFYIIEKEANIKFGFIVLTTL